MPFSYKLYKSSLACLIVSYFVLKELGLIKGLLDFIIFLLLFFLTFNLIFISSSLLFFFYTRPNKSTSLIAALITSLL
jgi:hypothetical protein